MKQNTIYWQINTTNTYQSRSFPQKKIIKSFIQHEYTTKCLTSGHISIYWLNIFFLLISIFFKIFNKIPLHRHNLCHSTQIVISQKYFDSVSILRNEWENWCAKRFFENLTFNLHTNTKGIMSIYVTVCMLVSFMLRYFVI